MKKARFQLFVLCLLPCFLQAQTPWLVVPVGNSSSITAVAFSRDGKLVVTGNYDGQVRMWDLSGRELQKFSTPRLNSAIAKVGFSPDGKQVWATDLNRNIALWDWNGEYLPGFLLASSVVFSHDGNSMLVGNKDNPGGIKLIDLSSPYSYDAELKMWDIAGGIIWNFDVNSYLKSAAFSSDDKKILTIDQQGTAKIWDVTSKTNSKVFKPKFEANSVAYSPDGKHILIGSALLDTTGRLLKDFKCKSAVFSPDGNMVLTANSSVVSFWSVRTKKRLKAFKAGNKDLESMAVSPDGKSILTCGWEKNAKLWDTSGVLLKTFTGHGCPSWNVAYALDGKKVLTGGDGVAKLWDLTGREIIDFSGPLAGYSKTSTIGFLDDGRAFLSLDTVYSPDGKLLLSFENKGVSYDPTYKSIILWDTSGKILHHFSMDSSKTRPIFSPDGNQIITVSANNFLRKWDITRQLVDSFNLYERKGYQITSIAFSPDGKQFLSGGRDFKSKLWDAASGELLATLIALDDTDWAITTPSGLFDASPGAMNLMYYVVDYEGEKIILDLEQLKARYWQPGLLSTVLGYSSNTLKNVGAFDNLALFPAIEAHIVEDSLFIRLRERNGGLGKLSLFLNNKRMKEDINPQRLKTLGFDLREFSSHYRLDTITTISLVAFEAKNYIRSQPFQLPYQPFVGKRGDGGSNTREKALPCRRSDRHLYVLVVGTSHYPPGEKSLPLADYDAAKIYEALVGTGKELYENRIHAKLLSTAGGADSTVSTKANIQAAFESFSRFETFSREATPCDVLVVFFAGHGATWGEDSDKSNFYYLTKDITSSQLNDEEARKAFAISDEELTGWLANFPGEYQLLILDACNSGKAAETMGNVVTRASDPDKVIAFDMMNGNTGSFVLTGTAPDMPAYESNTYEHGLLTYSLLDGMSGNALSEGRYVDVKTLLDHANKKVPFLAQSIGYEQYPIIARPKGNSSFSLGMNKGNVDIAVKQPKPMVIRSSFVDNVNLDDALGLTDAINDLFHAEKMKNGNQALWVYQDTPKNANGFSLKGVYWTNPDGSVTVKGKLKKGDKEVGEPFELNGSKDPELLARLILKKVKDWILGK